MRIGMLVSDNFFDVLGIHAALGRTFAPEEAQVPGRDAVVVLSYDFWKNGLAEDTSILDTVVWMNGIDFHVIGVTPATFTGTEVPLRPTPVTRRPSGVTRCGSPMRCRRHDHEQ